MRTGFLCFFIYLSFAQSAFAAFEVEISLPKSQYLVDVNPEDHNKAMQQLEKLDEEERKSFLTTRSEFLRLAASAFQKLKWGFGVGSVVKNRISFYRDRRDIKKQLAYADTLEDGDQRDTIISTVRSFEGELYEKQNAYKAQSFKEKADLVILNLLYNLDRNLWEGAPIVSRANEFGVMLALGPQLEVGLKSGKKFGGLFDVGISLGFNRDQGALIFQIFRDKEKLVSTQMPGIFIAGVVLKAGLMVSNQKNELTTEGSTFYPPVAPGFSTMTDRSFNVGFSSGLTWPPSPLGDILTYTNSNQRRVWLRFSFSRLQKGFIQVNEGLTEELKEVMLSLRSSKVMTCEGLF